MRQLTGNKFVVAGSFDLRVLALASHRVLPCSPFVDVAQCPHPSRINIRGPASVICESGRSADGPIEARREFAHAGLLACSHAGGNWSAWCAPP